MSKLLIHHGTLLDCTGAGPIADGAVLLEDNRIAAAGAERDIPLTDDEMVEVDAEGGFILPGFIDSHVHISSQGFDLEKMLMTPFSYNFYKAMTYFKRTLEAGITCVRDAGGADLGMKKAQEDGLFPGPRVKISINALSITGGHGNSWRPSGADLNQFAAYAGMPDGRCDGPDEVRKKVREMMRSGAEIIKIFRPAGFSVPPTALNIPSFHRKNWR